MTQNNKDNIIKKVGYYVVAVAPAAEGIAQEPHYAVVNIDTEVVEHRTSTAASAVQYAIHADKFYSIEVKGEKDVKLALANDIPLSVYANDPDFH